MINLDLINQAFSAKWFVTFQDNSIQGQWKDILVHKYNSVGANPYSASFWKDVNSTIPIITVGLNKIVSKGHSVLFWLDRWLYETNLTAVYPLLFSIATDEKITVQTVYASKSRSLVFRRQLVDEYLVE